MITIHTPSYCDCTSGTSDGRLWHTCPNGPAIGSDLSIKIEGENPKLTKAWRESNLGFGFARGRQAKMRQRMNSKSRMKAVSK